MKRSDKDHYEAWKSSAAEQRRFNRYPPADGVQARMEGRTYKLLDISIGGVAVYDYGGEKVPENTVLSLHSTGDGFYVGALRCRKVSDNRVISYLPHGPEVINRIGLEILENDTDMEKRLAPFMRK